MIRHVLKIEPRQEGYVALLSCAHTVPLDDKELRDLRRMKEMTMPCRECGREGEAE